MNDEHQPLRIVDDEEDSAVSSSNLSSNDTDSIVDDVEALEEEVALNESTLATLTAKLDAVDASIAREQEIINKRRIKVKALHDRKSELTQSHETNSKLVRKIESNLRKCLETLKKKMEDMRRKRIQQSCATTEFSITTNNDKSSSSLPLSSRETIFDNNIKPLDDALASTESTTINSSTIATNAQIHTKDILCCDAKESAYPSHTYQIEAINCRGAFLGESTKEQRNTHYYKEKCNNNHIPLKSNIEQRCHTGSIFPSIDSAAYMEHVLKSMMDEVIKGRTEMRQNAFLLGSCLDPFKLLYQWNSPGKRDAFPWELWKNNTVNTDYISIEKPHPSKKSEILGQRAENSISILSIHPNAILCPYDLGGTCLDVHCTYQHLHDDERQAKIREINPASSCEVASRLILPDLPLERTNIPPCICSDVNTANRSLSSLQDENPENNNERSRQTKVLSVTKAKSESSSSRRKRKRLKIGNGLTVAIMPQRKETEQISESTYKNVTNAINSEWKGEEQDYIELTDVTYVDFSKLHEKCSSDKIEAPQPSGWMSLAQIFWWLGETDRIFGNERSCHIHFPLSLCTFLSICGFSVTSKICDDGIRSMCVSYTRNLIPSKKSYMNEGSFVNLTQTNIFIASWLDCIRLSIFSGRHDLADALNKIGDSFFMEEDNTKVNPWDDKGKLLRKNPIFLSISNHVNQLVKESIMGGTAWNCFYHQVVFMLLSETLFMYHVSSSSQEPRYQMHEEKQPLHTDRQEHRSSSSFKSGPAPEGADVELTGRFFDCVNFHLVEDETQAQQKITKLLDAANIKRDNLEQSIMFWLRGELSTLAQVGGYQITPASALSKSGTKTPDSNDNTSQSSNPALVKKRLDLIFLCARTGVRLARHASMLWSKTTDDAHRESHVLPMIGQFMERTWSVVENFCIHKLGFAKEKFTKNWQSLCSVCGSLLMTPILLFFFERTMDCIAYDEQQRNKEDKCREHTAVNTSFFQLNTESYASLSTFDNLLNRCIKKLQSRNSKDMNNDGVFCDKCHINSLNEDILLSSLLSISTSVSVLLRLPNKAQLRFESSLSPLSSSTTCNKKHGGNSVFMVLSGLLWSQYLYLAICFPPKKEGKDDDDDERKNKLIESLTRRITEYNVHPSHLTFPGDFDLLTRALHLEDNEWHLFKKARNACRKLCTNRTELATAPHSERRIELSLPPTNIDDVVGSNRVEPSSPRRIESDGVRLSLSGVPLRFSKTLPMSVLLLSPRLVKLVLSDCALSYLPHTFGNHFVQLEELDVSRNSIARLPSSVGLCRRLSVLNLSSNRLSFLPDEMGNLHRLARLILSSNRLRAFPPALLDCRNLQDLDVSDNSIVVENIPRDLPLKLSKLVNFKFR